MWSLMHQSAYRIPDDAFQSLWEHNLNTEWKTSIKM